MKHLYGRPRPMGGRIRHGSHQIRPSGRFAVFGGSRRRELLGLRARAGPRAGGCCSTRDRSASTGLRAEAGVWPLSPVLRARLWLGSVMSRAGVRAGLEQTTFLIPELKAVGVEDHRCIVPG